MIWSGELVIAIASAILAAIAIIVSVASSVQAAKHKVTLIVLEKKIEVYTDFIDEVLLFACAKGTDLAPDIFQLSVDAEKLIVYLPEKYSIIIKTLAKYCLQLEQARLTEDSEKADILLGILDPLSRFATAAIKHDILLAQGKYCQACSFKRKNKAILSKKALKDLERKETKK